MKFYDTVGLEEWQQIADNCEFATYYHTPGWSRIFAKTYPNIEISTRKFILDNGTIVVLPLLKSKEQMGLLNSYVSNMAGVYGGIISDNRIEQKYINQIFEYLMKNRVLNISVTGNPFFNYNLPKQFNVINDFTQIIRLGKDEDEIWLTYKHDSNTRKKIKKAKNAGVICREAENIEEWKEYYSIYQKALERFGDNASNNYPFSLFENIFKEKMLNPEKIKLWLVIFEGKIVGGNLNFYHNLHCVEWHASFLSDYIKYNIRYLLVHNIILDANRKGYRYYDFNPSGKHENTVKFKDNFGPERFPIKRWEWQNPIIKIVINIKRKIVNF